MSTRTLLSRLAIVIALLAVPALLVACGDDDEDPAPTATQATTSTAAASPTATAEAANETSTFPVTVDTCGTQITYNQPPERVVAMESGPLEVLLALGLDEHIVGWFGSDTSRLLPEFKARAEAIEKLGSSFPYPSLEAVIGPDPDFVFSYGYNEAAGFTQERLAEVGVNNYTFDEMCGATSGARTMEGFYTNVQEVARIFGVEARAVELTDGYRAQIEEARAKLPDGHEPVKVFLEGSAIGDAENLFTLTGSHLFNDMLELAGAENIFGDVNQPTLRPSWEEVVARQPDLIIVTGRDQLEKVRAYIDSNPALASIPAVQNNRYMTLEYLETVPGPQVVSAVLKMIDEIAGE